MPSNESRVADGEWIVSSFRNNDGDLSADDKTVLTDVLTNLLHFCTREKMSFDEALRMARLHHGEEIGLASDYRCPACSWGRIGPGPCAKCNTTTVPAGEALSVCPNCTKVWPQNKLLPLINASDLGERLDPGSEVPSGECRECGAFTYFR